MCVCMYVCMHVCMCVTERYMPVQLLDNFVRARKAKVVIKSLVTTAHLRGAEAEALRDEVS